MTREGGEIFPTSLVKIFLVAFASSTPENLRDGFSRTTFPFVLVWRRMSTILRIKNRIFRRKGAPTLILKPRQLKIGSAVLEYKICSILEKI